MVVGGPDPGKGMVGITSAGGMPGFEGFAPRGTTPATDLGRELGEVQSGQRADIPSAIGGPVDRLYDTAVEQPAWAEDNRDVLGASVGEVADATGITDNLDPTSGDESGLLSGQSGVRAVLGLAVVLAAVVALGQLFTVNVGDSTA